MVPRTLLILIRTAQKRTTIEDLAWYDVDRYASPIFVHFEPDDV